MQLLQLRPHFCGACRRAFGTRGNLAIAEAIAVAFVRAQKKGPVRPEDETETLGIVIGQRVGRGRFVSRPYAKYYIPYSPRHFPPKSADYSA